MLGKRILKILKWMLIVILSVIVLIVLVRFAGQAINRITPKNGINESRYVDINGTKQWISIYSENKENPVLLYLHGGPFFATSALDYPMMRKLGKEFTVVNWDQRGSGHNYKKYPYDKAVDGEMMLKDAEEMTEYLLERFQTDKIFLFGSSWGSVLGGNMVLDHPEHYYAFLGTSAVIDVYEHQRVFKEVMREEYKDNPEILMLLDLYNEKMDAYSQAELYDKLEEKCVKKEAIMNCADYNILLGVFFNPYAGIDQIGLVTFNSKKYEEYMNILCPNTYDLITSLSLKDRKEYQVPVYYLVGREDVRPISMYREVAEYLEQISAPDKEIRYVDGGHFAATMSSETIRQYLHDIKEKNFE